MVDNTLTITTSTTSTKFLAVDVNRKGIMLMNIDATDTIYIGTNPLLSATNGFAIPPKFPISIEKPVYDPTSEWYCVASANTPKLTVLMGWGSK